MVKRICRCRTPTRDGSLRQEEAVGVRVEVCNACTGAELRNVVPWQGIAWSGGRGAGEGVQWELCVGIAVGEGRKKQVMRKRLPWRGGKACAATWCSGWRGSLAVCMGRRGEGGVRVQRGAQGTKTRRTRSGSRESTKNANSDDFILLKTHLQTKKRIPGFGEEQATQHVRFARVGIPLYRYTTDGIRRNVHSFK